MAQFKALSPKAEVNGAAVTAFVDEKLSFHGQTMVILSKHGIVDPQPNSWYRQQDWLDAFQEISHNVGPMTLKLIGKSIPENALWPPQVNDAHSALGSIDIAYHMNHRGGEVGHYRYEKTGERSARIVCDNPYPCDFDAGIIEAAAKRFAPQGALVRVVHDDTQPCRKKGGNSCSYLVAW